MPDASTSILNTVTCSQGIHTTIYWDPVYKHFSTIRVGLEDTQYKFCSYLDPVGRHSGGPCSCASTLRRSVHPRQWSNYLVHCNTGGDIISVRCAPWNDYCILCSWNPHIIYSKIYFIFNSLCLVSCQHISLTHSLARFIAAPLVDLLLSWPPEHPMLRNTLVFQIRQRKSSSLFRWLPYEPQRRWPRTLKQQLLWLLLGLLQASKIAWRLMTRTMKRMLPSLPLRRSHGVIVPSVKPILLQTLQT